MSKINFNVLVERELTKTVGQQIIDLLTIPGDLNLTKCAIWASLLDRTGVSYIKIDTLLSIRPGWPIIDTFFYIFKIFQSQKIIGTLTEDDAKRMAKFLNESYTIESFYKKVLKYQSILLKKNKELQPDASILQAIEDKINYLLQNYDDYREYTSPKLRQINDKTQILAAEEYLGLTPYDAIMRLLEEYGGYNTNLVKNILYYPGETRYTQRPIIEGPVMGTIIEISKLMLLFYREYIISQKETTGTLIADSIMNALKLNKDLNEFKVIVDDSAGKTSVSRGYASKVIQKDYKDFVHGRSVLTIDPSVPPPVKIPMSPPKPAIKTVKDFRNISGTSQEVYEAFIRLFNNITKGTHPSLWSVAGKAVASAINPLTKTLDAITAFAGHSLYGSTK